MTFNPAQIAVTTGEHKDQSVIWLRFEYDAEQIVKVKAIGAKWSQSAKCWFLKDSAPNRRLVGLPPSGIGKEALSNISAVNQAALKRMEATLILKAYSPSTIRTYCTEFAQLLYLLRDIDVASLTAERLRSYLLYCTRELGLSENGLQAG